MLNSKFNKEKGDLQPRSGEGPVDGKLLRDFKGRGSCKLQAKKISYHL